MKFIKMLDTAAKSRVFQSVNPKDFNANYELVEIPKDDSIENKFWNI